MYQLKVKIQDYLSIIKDDIDCDSLFSPNFDSSKELTTSRIFDEKYPIIRKNNKAITIERDTSIINPPMQIIAEKH